MASYILGGVFVCKNIYLSDINEKNESHNGEQKDNYSIFLRNCEKHFQQSDSKISLLDNGANLELLTIIVNHQRQVVLEMLGQNPEQEISLILQNSIDIYASQLNYIYGWTVGGKEMFGSSLELMYTNLLEKGLTGIDYEDMFQLAMLDALLNAEEYGISDSMLAKLGTLLEKSGSGGHNNWSYTPQQLDKLASEIWSTLYNSNIPKDSLAYKAMSAISGGTISSNMPSSLRNQFKPEVYNNANGGGWIKDDGNNNLDPMVKMVLVSNLLSTYPLSQAHLERLLKASSLSEIDKIVAEASDSEYSKALDFLFGGDDKWMNGYNPNIPLPDGVSIALDYDGHPDADYLKKLYKDFSGRKLSDSELEEINRIGDQVKMIQQTLKYWTQLCRDEQLAIVRNI